MRLASRSCSSSAKARSAPSARSARITVARSRRGSSREAPSVVPGTMHDSTCAPARLRGRGATRSLAIGSSGRMDACVSGNVSRRQGSRDLQARRARSSSELARQATLARRCCGDRDTKARSPCSGARPHLLSTGRSLRYGALLLATGAEPVRLAIPGADRALTLRTLADSRAIVAGAAPGRRAVVIGASFIGLEVAASLRQRKMEVTVVAPEARPLERVLGPELGDFVRALHEEHGVKFQLGRKPARIEAQAVALDDGTALPADLVVMGVGVRPRLQLAQQAGLRVD